MNDLLREKLEIINNDELLLKAIRQVFNERIEQEKPQVSETNDNSVLGEKYRAYETAMQIIEKGFTDLTAYKIDKKIIKNFSKER